jgi:hypothetical protein
MTAHKPPVEVERGTFDGPVPARDATRAHARPAELRAEARALRSMANRSIHAARQAATEIRRAARRLDADDPHHEQLLALAEHNDAYAAAWEAARPLVPTIPQRRQARRAPQHTLTAEGRALLEASGVDVAGILEAAAAARSSSASRRRRR